MREAAETASIQVRALAAVLVACVAAIYSGTLRAPLVFDDVPTIVDNPSLHSLATAFLPPARSTAGGRPVLNATLALNYRLGGLHVGGYHLANILVLAGSCLLLFGIARRTFAGLGAPWATPAGFSVALVWAAHPLLTGAVTYVVQRAESLMGLFYLLTIYAFVRAVQAGASQAWYFISAAACLLGMGTKEVMVSAPLAVLLYDRTFVAGGFRQAWRARTGFYLGLAATWILLLALVFSTHGRGGTAGPGNGVTWSGYAATQLAAVCRYLRLAFWPTGLVFDYGSSLAIGSGHLVASGILVSALAAATVWALVRRPAIGFLGACFFAILAPSSSIVPVTTEVMAEHRMFLPLIPVVASVVAAAFAALGRRALVPCVAAALVLGCLSRERNRVYGSEEALWRDTAEKLPENERAQNNLGNMLARDPGRIADAVSRYQAAIRLQPGYADAHYNLGVALGKLGRPAEALGEFEEAVRLEPDSVEARNNLGDSLMREGRTGEAVEQFEAAIRLDPGHARAHYNLGNALSSSGRPAEAAVQYREAVRLDPGHVEAHFNLGNTLALLGRPSEAAAEYSQAVRLRPGYAEAWYNLGNSLSAVGRADEALDAFERAIEARPNFADAHYNLAVALLNKPGRRGEAAEQLRTVLRLQPRNAEAARLLGKAEGDGP
jgi:tetratricopeptide (TPR) repeat protein/tryptophan-rich sensory protein